jgi:cysteine-rich secretory family protein
MRQTRLACGWLVTVALLVTLLTGLGAAPAAATGPGTGSVLSAVNASRAGAGREPLTLTADLSAVAYRWSQRMAASGTLAHNPSLTSQVTGWRWVGENVGYGPDWKSVQVAFMNSPAHRANILDEDYTQIGIGVVVSGGRVWITQVFRSPSGAARPAVASRPAATRTVTGPRTGTARTPSTSASRARAARKAAAAAVPTAAQLLARRITAAQSRVGALPAADPLASALSYADTMSALGR